MFVPRADDSKNYTDFNEPERLQPEDAMLLTFSEALVLFHSSLRRGYCTMSTNAHNSSTGPLYSSGKLGLVLLRALALAYLRYRPVLSAAPHFHHERCILLHTRIVRLQVWMSTYRLLSTSPNAPLSDQEQWCSIGYFTIGLSIPPFCHRFHGPTVKVSRSVYSGGDPRAFHLDGI